MPTRTGQDLDNYHRATAARAYRRLRPYLAVMCRFGLNGCFGGGLRSSMEQAPDQCHLGLPVAVGEKAVVTDALEAAGQDMQKEAADELLGIERHALWRGSVGVIFPSKTNTAVAESEDAAVGDGNPMGVTGEIGQHRFRPGEQRLSILPIITRRGSRSVTPTIRCTGKGARSCGKRTQKGNAIFV